MSDYQTIRIDKDGPVDWLTLNRPESLNAINVPMVRELRDYFGGLAEDELARIFAGEFGAQDGAEVNGQEASTEGQAPEEQV